jgi:capsular polysaccharide biosynthesis protein
MTVGLAALFVVLGAIAGLVTGMLRGPTYATTLQMVVQDRDLSAVLLGQNSTASDPSRLLDTYAVAGQSQAFASRLADAIGRRASDTTSISDQLTVEAHPDASVLDFTVSTASVTETRTVANAIRDEFPGFFAETFLPSPERLRELQESDDPTLAAQALKVQSLLGASPSLSVISNPNEVSKTSPSLTQSAAAGAVAGLIVGLLLAAWRHRKTPARFVHPAEDSSATVSPVLG